MVIQATSLLAGLTQVGMDFSVTIDAAALRPGMFDQPEQPLILPLLVQISALPARRSSRWDALSKSSKDDEPGNPPTVCR